MTGSGGAIPARHGPPGRHNEDAAVPIAPRVRASSRRREQAATLSGQRMAVAGPPCRSRCRDVSAGHGRDATSEPDGRRLRAARRAPEWRGWVLDMAPYDVIMALRLLCDHSAFRSPKRLADRWEVQERQHPWLLDNRPAGPTEYQENAERGTEGAVQPQASPAPRLPPCSKAFRTAVDRCFVADPDVFSPQVSGTRITLLDTAPPTRRGT